SFVRPSETNPILPLTAIGARPVNSPASALDWYPEQSLWNCPAGVMIERSRSFVEPSCMPGIGKLEMLKVEMVAVFVTKRAEKRSERSDFLLHRGTHPHPDGHCGRIVVAE